MCGSFRSASIMSLLHCVMKPRRSESIYWQSSYPKRRCVSLIAEPIVCGSVFRVNTLSFLCFCFGICLYAVFTLLQFADSCNPRGKSLKNGLGNFLYEKTKANCTNKWFFIKNFNTERVI